MLKPITTLFANIFQIDVRRDLVEARDWDIALFVIVFISKGKERKRLAV